MNLFMSDFFFSRSEPKVADNLMNFVLFFLKADSQLWTVQVGGVVPPETHIARSKSLEKKSFESIHQNLEKKISARSSQERK